jgi:phosphoribosylformylglycinamidine (FGAM) synthase-like enzyme
LTAKAYDVDACQGVLPELDWESENAAARCIENLRMSGYLLAVRDVGEGGSGITSIKMTLPLLLRGLCVEVLSPTAADFFAEGGSRYLLQLKNGCEEAAKVIASKHGLTLCPLVKITKSTAGQVKTYFGTLSSEDVVNAFNAAQPMGAQS